MTVLQALRIGRLAEAPAPTTGDRRDMDRSTGYPTIVGALGVRGAGTVVQLVMAVLFARQGSGVAGPFYVVLTWSMIVATVVARGRPFEIQRILAAPDAAAGGAFGRHVRRAARNGLILGCVIVVVAGATDGHRIAVTLAVAAVGTLAAVGRVCCEAAKAVGAAAVGLAGEFVLPYAGAMAGFGASMAVGRGRLVGEVVGLAAGWTTGIAVACRAVRRRSVAPEGEPANAVTGRGVSDSVVALVALLLPLAPPAVLSLVAGDQEVAVIAIAQRVAAGATVILSGIGAVFTPRLVRAHGLDDSLAFHAVRRSAQRWSMATFVPIALVLLVGAEVIADVFALGSAGPTVIRVIVVGQLVNAATGLSRESLVFSGRAAIAATIDLVTLAAVTAGVAVTSGPWGVVGTAGVFAVGIAGGNAAHWHFGRRP